MRMRLTDLLPVGHAGVKDYKKVGWGLVSVGDVITLPNTFANRTVYFYAILREAQSHAKKIGALVEAQSDNSDICISFLKEELKGMEMTLVSPEFPKHRGSYYGHEEAEHRPELKIFVPANWNLVSINFQHEDR